MGYARNHLATIVSGAFALVLTGLWPPFYDYAPTINFVFIMAVPIMWFMVLTVELKDSEIERLNQEILNLKTLVQIESLKSELANLKILSSKRK